MLKKGFIYIISLAFLALSGTVLFLYLFYPSAGNTPGIEVESTERQIERGRYLANHVAVCIDCHSDRNWSKFSGPIVDGTLGKGGELFDEKMGLPGTIYSKNITPYNLSNWTDGELYHIITTGVNKDGEPIFPLMPYRQYRHMDPDDIKAIIAYIRTLKPIENETPETTINFPVNLIMRTFPKPADPVNRPPASDTVAYGKYMTTISACTGCHTPENKGFKIEELYMAGGFEFQMPGGTIRSSNITPHMKTGIGTWSEQEFIDRFKRYDVPTDSLPSSSEQGFNTVMPWKMYAGMETDDLKAIFAYLKTIEPVENNVQRFSPAEQEN